MARSGRPGDDQRQGTPPARPSGWRSIWPPVDTPAAAWRASRHGFWAAVINVPLTLALLVIAAIGGHYRGRQLSDEIAYLAGAELLLFAPIIWGLWRHSPLAAGAGLLVYAASEILAWTWLSLPPDVFSAIVVAVFLLFFIHGVRGTVALRAQGQGAPPA